MVLAATLSGCLPDPWAPRTPTLEPDVWTRVNGGAGTGCADGSSYAFFVRPGSVNRLAVSFMGGGACWDAETCRRPIGGVENGEAYYSDHLDLTAEQMSSELHARGLLDTSNGRNPLREWFQVFIPYCTGDLHLGDATVTYGEETTVHHRGAANARAALDWIRDEFEAPGRLLVTGCSAGAYASIFWTPLLRARHPDAAMAQLGDSGAGIISEGFMDAALNGWNAASTLSQVLPDADPSALQRADALQRLYRLVAEAHPDVVLSQYNTLFDGVQAFFYGRMLGETADLDLVLDWSERMTASVDALEADVATFDSYIAHYDFGERGTPHCITPSDDVYHVATNGVEFLDWLRPLTQGRAPGTVRPLP